MNKTCNLLQRLVLFLIVNIINIFKLNEYYWLSNKSQKRLITLYIIMTIYFQWFLMNMKGETKGCDFCNFSALGHTWRQVDPPGKGLSSAEVVSWWRSATYLPAVGFPLCYKAVSLCFLVMVALASAVVWTYRQRKTQNSDFLTRIYFKNHNHSKFPLSSIHSVKKNIIMWL